MLVYKQHVVRLLQTLSFIYCSRYLMKQIGCLTWVLSK